MIENCGHDHLADMRAHSATQIFDTDDECVRQVSSIENEKDFFLGKLVNPSITPTRGSSPGYTTLEYHSLTDTLKDVKQTFLDMESTIGKPMGSVFTDFDYLYVDYAAQYGL